MASGSFAIKSGTGNPRGAQTFVQNTPAVY
jgi:hypothetical protein